MAHNTSHRRILADPDPPTDQRNPKLKPKPHAAKNRHSPPRQQLIHPLSDPAVATPPSLSTIQNISHRFSRLYANHKKQVSSHSSNPQPDPHFQTRKDPSFPSVPDSSRTAAAAGGGLFKSSSLKERNKPVGGIEKKYYSDDFKKPPCAEKIPSENGRSSVSCIPPAVFNEGGGRRRSFCSSQVELADFLSCSGVKVVAVDMPPFMQVHAVDCARKAHDSLEKFTSKSLAYTLKKEFDGVYGPAWHCIVGTSFGSFVTHSVGGFMYFSMDHKLYILLFKTNVQRAE